MIMSGLGATSLFMLSIVDSTVLYAIWRTLTYYSDESHTKSISSFYVSKVSKVPQPIKDFHNKEKKILFYTEKLNNSKFWYI